MESNARTTFTISLLSLEFSYSYAALFVLLFWIILFHSYVACVALHDKMFRFAKQQQSIKHVWKFSFTFNSRRIDIPVRDAFHIEKNLIKSSVFKWISPIAWNVEVVMSPESPVCYWVSISSHVFIWLFWTHNTHYYVLFFRFNDWDKM